MADKTVNDLTDAFDRRLEVMRRSRAPASEENAAILVYERVRTAQAIGQALMPEAVTESALLALVAELGRAAQASQGVDSLA